MAFLYQAAAKKNGSDYDARGGEKKGKHRKLRDRKIYLLLALQAQPDLPLTFPETHKHKSLCLIHKQVAPNNTVTLEYNTQENVHL